MKNFEIQPTHENILDEFEKDMQLQKSVTIDISRWLVVGHICGENLTKL